MAFQTHKGSFVANTSTGNQAVTGVGFQPKCIIFTVTNQTAEGFAAGQRIAVGFTSGASQSGAVAIASDDNAVIANAGVYQTGAAIEILADGSSTVEDAFASLVSFDSDGFTVNWSNAPASAWIVHYFALGGSDLTNAKVGLVTCPAGTGQTAVTGVGFQPDALLFLTGLRTTATQAAVNSRLMLGAAKSSSERAVTWIGENEAIPTTVYQGQRSDRCIAIGSPTALTLQADLVSMGSDGFTLDWSTVLSGREVVYLALKGGKYKIGTETQKTSTGTKATTGLGLTPSGLLLFGANATSNAAIDATQQRLSIGAGDGSNEGSVWTSAADAATPLTDTNVSTTTGKVLRHATNQATTDAEADLTLGQDSFTLDWTTADSTAREFIYVAFGTLTASLTDTATASEAASLEPGKVASDSVTASESVSKEAGPGLSDTVAVSDALVVEVGKALDDAVTVSDAVSSEEANALTLGDSVTVSDSQAKDVETVQADSVTPTDASVREAGLGLTDSVSVTDSDVKDVESVRADSVTATDAQTRDVETSLADSVTATDAESTEAGPTLSDSVAATDADARDVELVLTDSTSASDALQSDEGNDLVLGDSVTVTDSDLEELGVEQTQSLSDSVTATDSVTPVLTTTLPIPEGGWRPIYRQPLLYKLSLTDVVHIEDDTDTEYIEGIPTRQQKRELVLLA